MNNVAVKPALDAVSRWGMLGHLFGLRPMYRIPTTARLWLATTQRSSREITYSRIASLLFCRPAQCEPCSLSRRC
ncbi:hypothetical protein JG687_00016904 [Phytophthora cactorum]|uniref:Uncharacterized protein n=1 Tax=Phytophthora cactorum TaxID=29920 RepID=A0A8T1TQS0_9STRA|nr:hypothetical protein JG687_00016904 [Phytophthora cactorum]